ncbi:uncharacterized protein LOC125685788 isoform X2 [Lagopus muta]|uniref:uncharacterized protein LOC125685788 isoform X2 n=1 Tax=Lagopus muta TaxID=64668 RepID=UPI00209DFFD9|nr:uncharacterized protein LOC125685788 isoform X2 [Lagopus muta]
MGTWCPRGQEGGVAARANALSSALQKGCAAPMAPRGSCFNPVLVAVGLLPLCTVLLELWQPDPVLFVEHGAAVSIRCMADQWMDGAGKVLWFRHRPGEPPRELLNCIDRRRDVFSCEYQKDYAVLHIQAAQPKDAALYLCANLIATKLKFSNGTVLLVGDSWRTHSWVQVLATRWSPQSPLSPICAVGASGGPVLISRPGGDRPQEVLGLGNSTELLLSPGGAGGFCEVRFNASGPHIQRSMELHEAVGGCPLPSAVGMAVAGILLLLISLWLSARCLLPARAAQCWDHVPVPSSGHQPTVLEPPGSQGELLYAHLTLSGPALP